MTKLEYLHMQIKPTCSSHFVSHLVYRSSEKPHIRTMAGVWWKQSIYKIWKKSDTNDQESDHKKRRTDRQTE